MTTRYLGLISLLCIAACHHSGQGAGLVETPPPAGADTGRIEGEAVFMWQSGADASAGKIQALFPDGRKFSGTYLQVRSTTTSDAFGPYYDAWSSPWGGAPGWYAGPSENFVTEYSGNALAHLMSDDGTRMRCKFVLRDPARGMAGGGEGDCQLSTREEVFDAHLSETPADH